MWTPLDFGKHTGRTLPMIIFNDPDYFFWAYEEGVFGGYSLPSQARNINFRARRIRLPAGPSGRTATYVTDTRGKFSEIQVVHPGEYRDQGVAYSSAHIDLSVSHQLWKYDKGGGKLLIRDAKNYLFGDPGFKMTKGRAERFFLCDAIFCLNLDCPACVGNNAMRNATTV
jgi:hypothetical protein